MVELSEEQQREIKDLTLQGQKLEALALIRRLSDVDLKTAVEWLDQILGFPKKLIHTIGLSASLVAIGPYSRNIAAFLDYPEESYEKRQTREGALIISDVLFFESNPPKVERLANALGLANPWDFTHQQIDHSRVLLPQLREMATICNVGEFFFSSLKGRVSDSVLQRLERQLSPGLYSLDELREDLDATGHSTADVETIIDTTLNSFEESPELLSYFALRDAGFQFYFHLYDEAEHYRGGSRWG